MPQRDLARLRPEQLRPWRRESFAAVVRDSARLRDQEGHLLCLVNVGAVLPLVSRNFNKFQVLVPVAGDDGWAVIKQADLRADSAVAMPMPLNAANVAIVVNHFHGRVLRPGRLSGQPRGCSALVQDLYTPFASASGCPATPPSRPATGRPRS